jgi:hypothetical protein
VLIAESKLYGEQSGKRRVPVHFRVGAPKRDPRGSVCCKVHLRGIDPPRTIHGEDSLQALSLAFAFIHIRIRALQAEGWQFYFNQRDSDPFDVLLAWFPNCSEPVRTPPAKRTRANRKISHGR